ncbi:VirB8/TrbF family protein [Comamonas sp. w2-DMI]|uniref:VirB8/TrbF family protein n=1 Tax=Comamonas sp. w2-DMI TaxID=3126391 RepID=UPI0032E40A40
MGFFDLLNKRKGRSGQSDVEASLFDEDDVSTESISDAVPKKKKGAKGQSFYNLPQSEFIAEDPGLNDFAERWGSSSVSSARFFILAFFGLLIGLMGALYGWKASTEQKVVTVLVEFNGITGEYKKPVRIDKLTASDAMVKFGLGKWSEWVFTIDPKMSYGYLQDADVMTKGRARGQFADYRFKTEIIRHIKEGKKFIFAKTKNVDILQPGVAIVTLETEELDPNGGLLEKAHYRIRLDYSMSPPNDADLVLRNPIGLEIDGFTYERLVK